MHFTIILLAILPHTIRGAEDPLKDGPCIMDLKTHLSRIPPTDVVGHWYRLTTNTQNTKLLNRKCYEFDVTAFDGGWNLQTKYIDGNNQRHSFLEKVYRMPRTASVRGTTTDDKLHELGITGGNGRIYSFVKEVEGPAYLFHICKEFGKKHRDYYEVHSIPLLLPKEKLDQLKKFAKDLGDDRDFIDVDNSNCN